MTVLILDNDAGDWTKVYVDRELVAEGPRGTLSWASVLRYCGQTVVEEVLTTPIDE
jgi:hypothetical protein